MNQFCLIVTGHKWSGPSHGRNFVFKAKREVLGTRLIWVVGEAHFPFVNGRCHF